MLLWLLLGLTAAVYWPGLAGPLVLDDLENLQPLIGMQEGHLDWDEVLPGGVFSIGSRPLAMLSFVANWLTSAGEVWSLKYTNLMLHLLCGTLLFWLAGRLFAEPKACVEAQRWWLALLVAALWLLSPMLVSTVLYIVQRMAQLSALFVLAGLLCYVSGRQQLLARRRLGISLMVLCFALFWPLAVLSKQNGALLPLLAAAVEFGFFRRPALKADRCLIYGMLGILIVVPAVGAALVLSVDAKLLGGSYQAQDFSTYERALTQARVLFDYCLNLLLIPGGSPLGLFHDDFQLSRGLLSPPTTIAAIVAWFALLLLAWRLRASPWAAVLFGPVYFLAAHLLESTVIPLELYFEHRNYLPSTGLFLAVGVAAGRMLQHTGLKKTLIAVVAIVPLVHGLMTVARVVNWQSNETLLLTSQQNHPGSARVQTGLAGMYIERGDLDKAFEHLDRADALYHGRQSYAIALHRLSGYCTTQRPVEEAHYRALEDQGRITDSVYTANALRALVESAEGGGCRTIDLARVANTVDDDVSVLKGIGESDRNWALRLYTAKLLALVGRPRKAVQHALAVAELKPTWLEPGLLAIEYQIRLEDWDGARRTLAELRRRDDGRVGLYTRLIADYAQRLGE
jgi:tetratricopeptide (TPR) repeat protein